MLWSYSTGVSHTKMLTPEQSKNITYLYTKFLESEVKTWTSLDSFLELLEFLDDDQIYRECEVLYSFHRVKNMGCPYDHGVGVTCFVPRVLEAVESILELYKDTGNLHPKNRYVLVTYLGLCQDGQICELPQSSAI
jgi:hypothetical protein